jgi:hypothetical protein
MYVVTEFCVGSSRKILSYESVFYVGPGRTILSYFIEKRVGFEPVTMGSFRYRLELLTELCERAVYDD